MEKEKDNNKKDTKSIDYKKCKKELLEVLNQLKHETYLNDIKDENFNAEYINLLYKYETGNAFKITVERGPLPPIGNILFYKTNYQLLF